LKHLSWSKKPIGVGAEANELSKFMYLFYYVTVLRCWKF